MAEQMSSDEITLSPTIAERLRIVQKGLDGRPYNRMKRTINERERSLTGPENLMRGLLRARYVAATDGAMWGGMVISVASALTAAVFNHLTNTGAIPLESVGYYVPLAAGPVAMVGGALGLKGTLEKYKNPSRLDWLNALAGLPAGTDLEQAKASLERQQTARENRLRAKTDERHEIVKGYRLSKKGMGAAPGAA